MTRSERVAALLAALLAEPGWVSARRCAAALEVTHAPVAKDIELIRGHLDLIEHVLSDGEVVVTLPGRPGPPDHAKVPTRRQRDRGRLPPEVDHRRLSVERAAQGYELGAAGSTWA